VNAVPIGAEGCFQEHTSKRRLVPRKRGPPCMRSFLTSTTWKNP
jgi:hypothetical protein